MVLLSDGGLKFLSTKHPKAVIVAPLVVFGFATDVHCNDRADDVGGGYYYRDAVEKMAAAVATWNRRDLSFVMFGGDFIDGALHSQALIDISAIEAAYAASTAPRYYVFGNHCMDALSKSEFIANTGMDSAYYSFDSGGVHFVVLDGCYTADDDAAHYNAGNYNWTIAYINPAQRAWLAADLAATSLKTVVFCHQRLNGSTDYNIKNAAAVRSILEASGKVIAVINGHEHVNGFASVNGIPYYEMEAMLDGDFPINAYAVVSVYPTSIKIQGFGSQISY